MTYAAVDTVVLATRAAGDIQGQVALALLKQAATRILAVGSADPKESSICRTILESGGLTTWKTMVIEALDIQGNLSTHTDAQVDAAVVLAWTYFLASRQLN